MAAPDYSAWLTPERLAQTELDWAKMDRTELCDLIMSSTPDTVLEFCCGTGWIPKGLPPEVHYNGLDANAGCINLAMGKNLETRCFRTLDVRDYQVDPTPYDLALGFSCLKHFSLAEWDTIYGKILDSGDKTITSIFMSATDKEDERHGFPHTSVTMERVERVCAEHGHRIVQVMTLPPLNTEPEPLVLTVRIEGEAETITVADVGEMPAEVLDSMVEEPGTIERIEDE